MAMENTQSSCNWSWPESVQISTPQPDIWSEEGRTTAGSRSPQENRHLLQAIDCGTSTQLSSNISEGDEDVRPKPKEYDPCGLQLEHIPRTFATSNNLPNHRPTLVEKLPIDTQEVVWNSRRDLCDKSPSWRLASKSNRVFNPPQTPKELQAQEQWEETTGSGTIEAAIPASKQEVCPEKNMKRGKKPSCVKSFSSLVSRNPPGTALRKVHSSSRLGLGSKIKKPPLETGIHPAHKRLIKASRSNIDIRRASNSWVWPQFPQQRRQALLQPSNTLQSQSAERVSRYDSLMVILFYFLFLVFSSFADQVCIPFSYHRMQIL